MSRAARNRRGRIQPYAWLGAGAVTLGLGMGVEQPEPDVMKRRPISPGAQIFDRRMVRHILVTGGTIGLASILLSRHYWASHPGETWQTVLFLVCTIPFWTSNIIRMISWIPFLGRNGLLNSALLGVGLILDSVAYHERQRAELDLLCLHSSRTGPAP